MTFLIAGHETVNISIGWALHLLSQHPHDQDLLREELVKAFPDKSKFNPTLDEMNSLEYLNCVVKETLRSNSPGTITFFFKKIKKKFQKLLLTHYFFTVITLSRNNIKDKVFGEYFIPKVYLSYLLFY